MCDLDQNCGPGAGNDESNCTAAHMCDFQSSGFCDWSQDATDDFDWLRRVGATPTQSTGPSRDHTTGLSSGAYIYTESSSPRRAGQKARLLSPVLQAATPSDGCRLSLYYSMYGRNMGALNVYARVSTRGYMTRLLGRSGDLGQAWARFSQPLVFGQPFQVVVEGVVGRGYLGDLAVDDLVLSAGCRYATGAGATLPPAGYLTTTPSTTPDLCGAGKFQCGDGSCLALVHHCDYTRDCRDGSDEAGCGACDFEKGLCGYRDMSVGRYNWTRTGAGAGAGAGGALGPAADHTTRGPAGHYAYVEGTRGVFRQVALLQSPVLPAFSRSCMMTFFYFTGGPQAGSLEVGAAGNGSAYRRLYVSPHYYRPSTSLWRPAYVYLGSNLALIPAGSRLEFRVRPGLGRLANNSDDIAIDDIAFRNCDLKMFPPTVACSFERGLCGWSQAQNDQFDWRLSNHSTPSRGTGPQFDHTRPGRGGGVFAYIESGGRRAGDAAILQTPWLSPTDDRGYCLGFWYHMFGSTVGNLTLSLVTPSSMQTFWSGGGPRGDLWRRVRRTVQSSQAYSLYFQASVGGSLGDIAIDDVTATRGPCPPPAGCDFEEGLCGWTLGQPGDRLNWTLGSGGAAFRDTGPRLDHTFGSSTGHYAYLDPSRGRPGDSASLVSSPLRSSSFSPYYIPSGCLQFWYYMAGGGTGSLNVSLLLNATGAATGAATAPRALWGMQGDQGAFWRHASVQLPFVRTRGGFSVAIEASRGSGFRGKIAVDDVLYSRARCPPPGRCNFEADACGYVNVPGDDFDWQRDNGGTATASTGPTTDHTRRTAAGYYMYIESNGYHRPGDRAWLVSETIPAPRSALGGCVNFYYHMYGAGMGTLNVYTGPPESSSSQNKTLVWTVSGNQGNVWLSGRAPVSANQSYAVTFEGVYGGNYTGDLAIDDVVVSASRCYGVTTTSTPPTTVTSPVTYPRTGVDCDFESAMCNWRQDAGDQFDWRLYSGQTPSVGTGPTADHTFGSDRGHYAYIQASGVRAGSSARLLSAPYAVGAAGACFKFWYYMYGRSVNTLKLWTQVGTGTRSLVSHVTSVKGRPACLPACVRVSECVCECSICSCVCTGLFINSTKETSSTMDPQRRPRPSVEVHPDLYDICPNVVCVCVCVCCPGSNGPAVLTSILTLCVCVVPRQQWTSSADTCPNVACVCVCVCVCVCACVCCP